MEVSAPTDKIVNKPKKKSVGRDNAKVSRKIHKAEREKLKRDRMNELFLDLIKAIEPASQNNGKSSALTCTIRLIQDLVAQVESLKKENAVLLAESQYVAVENDELKEENSVIEAQVKKLQSQIDEKIHSRSLWSTESNPVVLQPAAEGVTQAATSVLGSVFVLPLHNDQHLKLYAEPKNPEDVTNPLGPNVSKPQARYPSPSDSWPFNILSEQPRAK